MRFTIPGDGQIRPSLVSSKRPVRCETFEVDIPDLSTMQNRAEVKGDSVEEAIQRSVKNLGRRNFTVYGIGHQVREDGSNLSARGTSERIDLDDNDDLLDAIVLAIPGAFLDRARVAREAYEKTIANIAADQSVMNSVLSLLEA